MAEDGKGGPEIVTRRYTGATRADAEAGFKLDWPRLSGRFTLLAEAWDPDTHTLSVMLAPIPPAGGGAERPGHPAVER